MPYMRETAWAVCQTTDEKSGFACVWAESGPNVVNAALAHEQETGHVVLVGDRDWGARK